MIVERVMTKDDKSDEDKAKDDKLVIRRIERQEDR